MIYFVRFQRLYQTLLLNKGANVDYRGSSVSNRVLKQALLMRLRSWFEQGKVVIPYGNDHTRKMMNEMLEELETHAWDGGLIVDKGRHNDIVMALAHAVDQIKSKSGNDSPMVGSSASMGKWGKATTQRSTNPHQDANSSYVRFRL